MYYSILWFSASGGCCARTCYDATPCQTLRLDLTLPLGTVLVMVVKLDLLGDDGMGG